MRRLLAALLLLSLLAGCGKYARRPPLGSGVKSDPIMPSISIEEIVSGQTALGIQSLQHLRQNKGEQNWLLSPISAYMALSMMANGAKGETQAQIRKAIGLASERSMEWVDNGNSYLQSVLAHPDPKVELSVANSLWLKEGRSVEHFFADRAKRAYRVEFQSLPFGNDPAASGAINDWVYRATDGRIPTLVEKTNPEDVLYLLSANYFKGAWQRPFEQESTKPEPFHRLHGATVTVPMMHQSGQYRYMKGEGFQATVLPFAEGRVSLYLFRPDDGVTFPDFLAKLTPAALEGWFKGFSAALNQGHVALPRFALSSKADLMEPLMRLGMVVPFTDQADFGHIFGSKDQSLAISAVFQSSFLSLNEEGADAAAATAVAAGVTSSPPESPAFDLRLDRPFFLVIRHEYTGAILFLGTVVDPS